MERLRKTILTLLLALCFVCLPALAAVRATGDVNIRSGPGLGFDVIASVAQGTQLEDLGGTSTDDRGIDWYNIRYGALEGWVSSVYSERTGGAPVHSAPASTAKAGEVRELSVCYMQDLDQAASDIGFKNFETVASEAPRRYYDAAAAISGEKVCEHIEIFGAGYSLFGVKLGMSKDQVRACMAQTDLYELTDMERSDFLCFERAGTGSWDAFGSGGWDAFGSCVNVTFGSGGVTEIDWSTYTG